MRIRSMRTYILLLTALFMLIATACDQSSAGSSNEGTVGSDAAGAENSRQPEDTAGLLLVSDIIDSSTLTADPDRFYGLGNSLFEFHKYGKADYRESIAAMKALGVTTVRLWLHNDFVMSDANTFKDNDLKLMKDIVAELAKEDLEIIGMNHHWFNGSNDTMAVPMRDMSEGSAYRKFLLNYDQTWYNLVKEFPEITKWEIGNEWNSDTFLHPYDYKTRSLIFGFSEKADITTDMLYYASRGIHRANKDAITILGGLIDIYDTGYGNGVNFLKRLYENIESGDWPSINPDDYFQIVGWHPYNERSDVNEEWSDRILKMYDVVKEYEGHDKLVYFTELGWSDYGSAEADREQAVYMERAMAMIEERMPFVAAIHWFTLYNDQTARSWGGEKEVNFGLFEEPNRGFYPKEKGKMYQKLANGTGDLNQFAEQ